MTWIYLDHNATTPMHPRVLDAMQPYLQGWAGNPSSRHASGRKARQAVDAARQRIARALDAKPNEVFFTSGATEGNNLAILGAANATTIAINPTEHPSCLEPARHRAKQGVGVTELAVDEFGRVRSADIGLPNRLVVVQLANSETGVIQDIQKLAWAVHAARFHCDAVQAVGRIPVSFRDLGVSSMTVSGHKIGGPPGVGVLLIRADASLAPQLFGGHQQAGVRAGTEPVAAIVGLATAIAEAVEHEPETARRLGQLRDRLEESLLSRVHDAVVNAPVDSAERLPNTSNISFPGAAAQALVMALDLAGVGAAAGSACASGSMRPSHVLEAMGIAGERLSGAVRFSLGWTTTEEEIDAAADIVALTVARVRSAFANSKSVASR